LALWGVVSSHQPYDGGKGAVVDVPPGVQVPPDDQRMMLVMISRLNMTIVMISRLHMTLVMILRLQMMLVMISRLQMMPVVISRLHTC